MKKFELFMIVQLAASALFTILSLSFSADISMAAFPLALVFTSLTVYFCFFRMLRARDGKYVSVSLKFTQYLPFVLLLSFIVRRAGRNGTPFWYDLVTVLLWIAVFFCSLFTQHSMSGKNAAGLTADWKVSVPERGRRHGIRRILAEIVDWADALVQAVFTVLLIQIFILQLYVIPSESMVPEFLIKDRVAVSKLNCGPKFPLTDIGLPVLTKYRRGDIVVLRNPHYTMDRNSEVKTVVSQLVYMLTFMAVNLNTDGNGELKADPLVKRIAGVGGEQLVMQDGVLYSRTAESGVFAPVSADAGYAAWNLNDYPELVRGGRIHTVPLSSAEYDRMISFEEERRSLDLKKAAGEAELIAGDFAALCASVRTGGTYTPQGMYVHELFNGIPDSTLRMMYMEGGKEWFSEFMMSWISGAELERDMYSEANFRMNVMAKLCFGRLVLSCAGALADGEPVAAWAAESGTASLYRQAETIRWYVQGLLDERNMPVFPPDDDSGNPQYIPDGCYFMMGDNRFNSLDLRHSYEQRPVSLASGDPLSVEYYSMMQPQYVSSRYIIGKPVFRFWPLSRAGLVD